jgi:hypothetical protein
MISSFMYVVVRVFRGGVAPPAQICSDPRCFVAGYRRLTGARGTVARLRSLRHWLIDPPTVCADADKVIE